MNMQNLMAQAQKMQRDIEKKQKEINETKFESTTQAVTITLMGDKTLDSIVIDKSIIEDSDDLDALEDMIKIAHNDALSKIQKETEAKLGSYSKSLNGLF